MSDTQQWEDDARQVASYYTDKVAEKGYSFETLAGREEKYANMFFGELLAGLPLASGASLLDIGSGLGLLIPYLKSRNIELGEYLGIDLIPGFVEYSKKAYPDYEFRVGNFISSSFKLEGKYDFVMALGVLVSRVNNYEEYLASFITKMIQHSQKYVLFNLITHVDNHSPNYSHKELVGGITPVPRATVEKILNSIPGITYVIIEKSIFDDAMDAFVQITIAA
jgi:cyclopropane fatty-acyl-phospholipid synthase-like methyltransferase